MPNRFMNEKGFFKSTEDVAVLKLMANTVTEMMNVYVDREKLTPDELQTAAFFITSEVVQAFSQLHLQMLLRSMDDPQG